MKRLFLKLLLITCAIASTFVLSSCLTSLVACTACSKSACSHRGEDRKDMHVDYSLNADGQSYCLGGVGEDVEELIIPAEYNGLPVTRIARGSLTYSYSTGCGGGVSNVPLTKLVIPETVTRIDYGAIEYDAHFPNVYFEGTSEQWCKIFFGCSLLGENTKFYIQGEEVKDFIVPQTVTELGANTFKNYGGLKRVVFHEDMTSIGAYAFYGCKNLASPVFPYGISDIGEGAFSYCKTFTEIVLPASLDVIPSYAFEYCSGLKTVEFPAPVTFIGDYAFYGCVELENIDLSYSEIDCIYRGTFGECSSLQKFIVPETVTQIEDGAFLGCMRLYEIYNLSRLPITAGNSNCGEIAKNAVIVHSSLDESSSVQVEGDFMFMVAEGNFLIKYTGESLNVALPDNLNGEGYVIHNYAFLKNGLRTVTIPQTVSSIGAGAFSECESLQAVYGMDGAEIIGEYAFARCKNLSSVDISHAREIGIYAFAQCAKLENVTISAQKIGKNAFSNCAGLASATLNEGIEEIGNGAFSGSGLTAITVPQSVKLIGANTFSGCASLKTASTGGAEEIESYAFTNCNNLTDLKLCEGLKIIRNSAFRNCFALTDVALPASLEMLQTSAFEGCLDITSLTVANGNEVYVSGGNCIINRANKMLVLGCKTSQIPADGSVEVIGRLAFDDCKITSLTVPETVTRIVEQSFWSCDLVSITFLGGVEIGSHSFSNCNRLEKIVFKNPNVKLGESMTAFCSKLKTFEYAGTVEEWKSLPRGEDMSMCQAVTVICKNGKYEESWN